MYKIKNFFVNEFCAYNRTEMIFSLFALTFLIVISIIKSDDILAILASTFGLLYTITSGKGKIYCYYFGIIGTISCAIISLQISLYGYAFLHFLYYLPMEIIGIYSWKQHLQTNSNEIVKTKLSSLGLTILIITTPILTSLIYLIFKNIEDVSPLPDALILVLSILGMVLTVKRCIEQWIIWTIVNILSVWMWFDVFLQGERTFSILVVRIIYFIIGVYFFFSWKKSFSKTI